MNLKLRDYQQRTIDMTMDYLNTNDGNPCVVLPTGAGKSIINAYLCNQMVNAGARVLSLTHVRELIEQNSNAMKKFYPLVDFGIHTNGLNRHDISNQLIFGGIQSVYKKAKLIGSIDLVIIDEVHLVNHKNEGCYRSFIEDLQNINNNISVIGLTATPWRLGHGLITDGDTILDDIIEPVTVEELIESGHLSMARSKCTEVIYDVSKVKKTAGDYNKKDLNDTVNTDIYNQNIADEIMARAGDRQHWLIFCSGVDHAIDMANALNMAGIKSESLSGRDSIAERDRKINAFKAGKIKALTNAEILTTGFDYPDIDLLAILRPTHSPSLHVQIIGRGMRPKSHTDHCLILDFAGNIRRLGPITNVRPPKKSRGGGEAPIKTCEQCFELLHLSVMKCPVCGYEFPQLSKSERLKLHHDCVLGYETLDFNCSSWHWSVHTKKSTGIEMLKVSYFQESILDESISEYLTVLHDGWVGKKAVNLLKIIGEKSDTDIVTPKNLYELAEKLNIGIPPSRIEYKMKGEYPNIVSRHWNKIPF